MQLILTNHALKKKQRWGIPREAVEIVYTYGKCYRTWQGFRYEIDDEGRQKARADIGEVNFRRIVDRLDIYIIVDLDRNEIITVAHRFKRRKAA